MYVSGCRSEIRKKNNLFISDKKKKKFLNVRKIGRKIIVEIFEKDKKTHLDHG